mmetsp:Transcript_25951/g.51732  ORF Transcript_25951/g.51732 Transcript_25951/m.51732 type:complete len:443 (+) Transcript_25951:234-1562(+)
MSATNEKQDDNSLAISVSDPVQQTEGSMNKKYTSYKVNVYSPVPNFLSFTGNFSVLRRYSDFNWLHDSLLKEFPGACVPPIPEKQAVARFNPEFVEQRRVGCERFLRRVAAHPELFEAVCFKQFIQADDIQFAMHKREFSNAEKNKAKDGIFQWVAETKTSMKNDLVRSPEDELFEEITHYVTSLESQMKNVAQHTSVLVRKGKELANGLFEFGLAFTLLGQSEADSLGGALTQVGHTADTLSVLSADQADKEAAKFEEPLIDYIKLIQALKHALAKRQEKRVTYSTNLANVSEKQNLVNKYNGIFGKEDKAAHANISLQHAQHACEISRVDYINVSQRVLREVDRFKREKEQAMRQTVMDYIILQVEYNKRMEEVWGSLLPQLESVNLDGQPQEGTQNQAPIPPISGNGLTMESGSDIKFYVSGRPPHAGPGPKEVAGAGM